jgi:outer membrane protein OmpA-like peptidoglycan-associated protein
MSLLTVGRVSHLAIRTRIEISTVRARSRSYRPAGRLRPWRIMRIVPALLLLWCHVGPRAAHAEPGRLEVGAKVGPGWVTHNGDRGGSIENAYDSGISGGLDLRYGVSRLLDVQVEILYAPRGALLEGRLGSYGGFFFSYLQIPLLARLEWQIPGLSTGVGRSPLSAYVVAGPALGVLLSAEEEDDSGRHELPRSELHTYDVSASGGVGLVWNATPRWAASLEVRYDWGFVNAFQATPNGLETKNRAILLTLGIELALNDRDGDGLSNGRDRCADESEDWNAYKDADGCPDADEDGDGILAGDDACPTEAEVRNGYLDTDGCPEADDDSDGVIGDADQCRDKPEDRNGYLDDDGCPDADLDGDGIAVGIDKCIDEAEDKDEYEDTDGCPDPDNDGDGFADAADDCDNQPFPRMNGCPPDAERGFTLVRVAGDLIVAEPPLEFDRDSAVLSREHRQALDQVARLLTSYYPGMHVRLEGHADGEGKRGRNKTLSGQRANTVFRYLLGQGVERRRLVEIGHGAEKPIRREETEAGKRRNRRVEIVIIENP